MLKINIYKNNIFFRYTIDCQQEHWTDGDYRIEVTKHSIFFNQITCCLFHNHQITRISLYHPQLPEKNIFYNLRHANGVWLHPNKLLYVFKPYDIKTEYSYPEIKYLHL